MSPARLVPILLAAGLVACTETRKPVAASDSAPPAPPRPADSLVLKTPGGVEVWFSDSRTAHDSTGATCVERVMHIRREGQRIPIPLLYTGQAPVLVNDSTIEAAIWLNCRAGNVYRVNLRTGQPVRVR